MKIQFLVGGVAPLGPSPGPMWRLDPRHFQRIFYNSIYILESILCLLFLDHDDNQDDVSGDDEDYDEAYQEETGDDDEDEEDEEEDDEDEDDVSCSTFVTF